MCDIELFYELLEEKKKPKEALLCMSAAVHKVQGEVVNHSLTSQISCPRNICNVRCKQVLMAIEDSNRSEVDRKINIRLYNYPESMIALKNLKAASIGNVPYRFSCCFQYIQVNLAYLIRKVKSILSYFMIDKLVSLRGTVVKASTVKPLVVEMSFDCAKCKSSIKRIFPDGKFSPPAICTLHGCKSRTFVPIRSTAHAIDFQKIRYAGRKYACAHYFFFLHCSVISHILIEQKTSNFFTKSPFFFSISFFSSMFRLQELLKSESHEEGRVPRTVECELTEDLVDACIPGDVVTITGYVKVMNNYMDIGGGTMKKTNKSSAFMLCTRDC